MWNFIPGIGITLFGSSTGLEKSMERAIMEAKQLLDCSAIDIIFMGESILGIQTKYSFSGTRFQNF
jgi:hypothetical protein